ncbi:glycosyltransferase [Hydrogenophaga sp. PAMC20947]|uniref:glycosyltransferase n=1 Tax=Hydrogenophaga sp. PAMC20947 TaxID=2565558 RepID=UPI00109DB362|nr:glycosyltransferase [Hydrogenophaga sp. PAMC20947]QCB47786.1 glycosyltransferase [Hydrogenophaga sp. PAMC20947]
MSKKKSTMKIDNQLLIIHPVLAPYRVNFFNSLGSLFNLKICFEFSNSWNNNFDQAALRAALRVRYKYLTDGFILLGRRAFRPSILREIYTFKPQVVVTSEFSLATIITLIYCHISKKTKHVIWTDDNPDFMLLDSKIRKYLRHLTLPRVNGVICLSSQTAEYYRSTYGLKIPIESSLMLQEETEFSKGLEESTNLAVSLAESNNLIGKRIILFVGRLSVEKQVAALIRAFGNVNDRIVETRLVIVGHGPEKSNLIQLAKDLGIESRVIFAGNVQGLHRYAWYRVGQLLVLPSSFEAFGAVVNEALLSGMPVLCSDKVGAKALISSNINGDIFKYGNDDELVLKMNGIIKSLDSLTIPSLSKIRPSLMSHTFYESVQNFSNLIKKVIAS